MEQYLISVDLGGSKVTAALGMLSMEGETVVVDAVTRPMEGFTRGEVTNIELVTTAIGEAVSQLEVRNEVKASEVWISISGKHVVKATNSGFVYVGGADGEVTTRDVDKLHDNMANVQAPDGKVIIARIPQSYKVDSNETIGSPVGRFGTRLETSFGFVLAGEKALERITKAFKRCGIENIHYTSGAIASATVAATDEEKESGVIVIDLGAASTDLCIIQNKVVRHVASIPIGSADINKDILSIGVPLKTAEVLKVNHGYASHSSIPEEKRSKGVSISRTPGKKKGDVVSYHDLVTIIESRMTDIIEYVIAEIQASGYHNRLASGIVLTGGASRLVGVESLFSELTGYDVRLGCAENGVEEPSIEKWGAPENTTAIGMLQLGMIEAGIAPSAQTRSVMEEVIIQPERPETPTTPAATTPVTPATPATPATPDTNKLNEGSNQETNGNLTDVDGNNPEKPRKRIFGGMKNFRSKVFDFFFGNEVVDDQNME